MVNVGLIYFMKQYFTLKFIDSSKNHIASIYNNKSLFENDNFVEEHKDNSKKFVNFFQIMNKLAVIKITEKVA